ncbi:MAG: XdhC family protein [Dehalococcoidia bacterium]|nr:XdhC family protein [Dehalococcoidia bacterium]
MLELTKRLLLAAEGADPVLLASLLEPGPRLLQPGARLLVEPSGERTGSLGDALLDAAVAAYAPSAFARHTAETVYVTDAALAETEEVEPGSAPAAGSDLPVALSSRAVAGATSIYLEVVEHKPVFLIVGAGHVGRALARLADFLGFHVAVLDDREEFASAERIPEADEVICDDFEAALDRYPIGANTHVVMVTRGHKQDEVSLRRCLGRGAAYLGMIGSHRRTATVLEHLRDEGFEAAELARVRTPIGLDIGAETPEEIAISVMAEVILLRRGGTGAPMYHRPASLRYP